MKRPLVVRAALAVAALAVVAPFLAHEAPLLVVGPDGWETPLLCSFDAEDILWCGGGVLALLFALLRRFLPGRRALRRSAVAIGALLALLVAVQHEPENVAVRDFEAQKKQGALVLRPLLAWGHRREDPASEATRMPPFQAWDHPLGTDASGRDVASRLVHGARTALSVGLLTTLLASVLGIVVGALSAWWGGFWDRLTSFVILVFSCFPLVVLLLALQEVMPPGVLWTASLLAAVRWIVPARLMRHETLRLKQEPFVEAARTLGLKPVRILRIHVLPHARNSLLVSAAFGIGLAVTLEAGLSFLGFGVSGSRPSWGRMLADGRAFFRESPHLVVVPGLALLALVLLAHRLADALRERGERPLEEAQG